MRAFTSFVLAALAASPAFAAPIAPIEIDGPIDFHTGRVGPTPLKARQGGPIQGVQSSQPVDLTTDTTASASAPASTPSSQAFNIRPGFGPGPVILPREPLRPVSFIPVSALQGAQGKRQLPYGSFANPAQGPIGQGPVVKRQAGRVGRPAGVLVNPLHPAGGPVLNQRQEAEAGGESTEPTGSEASGSATETEAGATATATEAAGAATATEAAGAPTATEAAGAPTATEGAGEATGTEAAGEAATATEAAGGAEATGSATAPATGTEEGGAATASGAATAPEAGASGAAEATGAASGEAPAAAGTPPASGEAGGAAGATPTGGAGGRPGAGLPYGGYGVKGPGRMYGFMKDGSAVPMGEAPAQ